jgi:serine/threonine protein kinase
MSSDDVHSTNGSSARLPSAASTTDLGPVHLKVEADDSVGLNQIIDGRYRIVKKLGEGGMGEVYAAEHIHIEKRVAVKLLRSEILGNKEAVQRFRLEARSASSIGHPNIIAIEDFGELPDGRIYLCMELLDGEPLNDMIKEQIAPERILDILIQTCHGLAAAHSRGIVHRDMKPENIFVTRTAEGRDVPKLLDFGIAKVQGTDGDNNLTKTGMIFGTPFYMAPEQAMGEGIDHRADIYAMGVIMYEIFTGSIPFEGESFMGILTKHITAEPEAPTQRALRNGRSLLPGVEPIILRAMKKSVDERYQSMDELTNALVSLRRSLVGPGMSSYMEAHVVPSGMMAAIDHPAGHPAGSALMPAASSASPYYHTPSGAMPAVGASHSALAPYDSHYGHDAASSSTFTPRKSSKAGLVAAIIAVLAVAGGIVGFLVSSSAKDQNQAIADTTDPGNTTGSDVTAGKDTAGSGVTAGKDTAGSGVIAGNDSAGKDTADTGTSAGNDQGNSTVGTVITPDVPTPVKVLVISEPRAMVVRDGKNLGQTPRNIDVMPGEPVTVTLTRKSYEDHQVTLDGSAESLEVKLSKRRSTSASSGKSGTSSGNAGNSGGKGDGDKSNNDQKAGNLGLGLE